MSKIKKYTDSPIYLEPIKHQYHHKVSGKIYKSVTTTLTSLEPHFDSNSISLAISKQSDKVKQAKYIGLRQEDILTLWEKINNEANIYGTKIHNIIEEYLLANKWQFFDDTEDGKLKQSVIDSFNELKIDEGVCMYPERILFSERYELAGTSDLIIDIDDVFFSIWDWKTNREFNIYNKFGGVTLNSPFDYLQASQFSIYTLQLSVYARLYEMENPKRKCRDINIAHWDKETCKFVRIPIMYMKNEAQKLIEMHYENIGK